jgi:DNA-binding protein HU-beta
LILRGVSRLSAPTRKDFFNCLTPAMRACYKEAGAFSSAFADIPTDKTVTLPPLRDEGAAARGTVSHQSVKGTTVNKSELVEVVSKSAGISKSASEKAVDGAIDAIMGALKRGQSVTLVGFGTFRVGRREARSGRNPRTGEEIRIKAAKVPKFSAGKALKDALN